MARCEKCSYELADVDKQCPQCGAIAPSKDSTLVNTDFDAAELLRQAAALRSQDESETRQQDVPRDETMSYDDGRPEFVNEILREVGLHRDADPDASGDSTSVFTGPVGLGATAPNQAIGNEPSDADPTMLAQSRDDILAAAGFPPPIDDYEDDSPTSNMGEDDDDEGANDRTIQTEHSIEDFLDDAEIRASINKLREKAGKDPLAHTDANTFEMASQKRATEDMDNGSTVQLTRADVLEQTDANDFGDVLDDGATVELSTMQRPTSLPDPRPTQPTATPLPPIPLPKHATQPAQVQPPQQQQASQPKSQAGSLIIPAPQNNPHGSGFAQQPNFGPQGSGFPQQPNPGPQGSGFAQQPNYGPQGSGFPQQPQQFNPHGSGFAQQPNYGPQGSGFPPQPNMGPQGSQFPPAPNGGNYGPRSMESLQPPAPQAPQSAKKKGIGKVELIVLVALVALAVVGVALVLLF